jgi:hypothetical protein
MENDKKKSSVSALAVLVPVEAYSRNLGLYRAHPRADSRFDRSHPGNRLEPNGHRRHLRRPPDPVWGDADDSLYFLKMASGRS